MFYSVSEACHPGGVIPPVRHISIANDEWVVSIKVFKMLFDLNLEPEGDPSH